MSENKSSVLNMTTGNPVSLILKFTLPLLVGNIFQQLYNMVDTIIVGNFVGTTALAAVGSTGTIMFMLFSLSVGLTSGFTVLTSQRFGADDYEGTRRSFSNGVILSMIISILLTIGSLLVLNPVLQMMNTPSDMYSDAYNYISVICLGTIASVFYNLFSSYLRAIGNSKIPLYVLVFSSILNVILDLLFIIVFKMGTAGAAWATDIAQGISAILCLIYIYKNVPILVPTKEMWKLDMDYSKRQLSIGLPMCVQFAITASGTMIMQTAINMFGSVAVAAFTATSKIGNILTQGFTSAGQTITKYCGQNAGKDDIDRIQSGTRSAMLISGIYAVAIGGIAVLALPLLIQLFFESGADLTTMMPYARTYMYLCASFYIPLAMIFVYRNAIQGCGYGAPSMILGFAELVARLVMAFISMKVGSYLLAVACDPAAWLVAGILAYIIFRVILKDMRSRRMSL